MIARAVQRILSVDHEVVALARARDALERITAGERFDVIVCDLMMPELTGMELHAALSRVAPEQASAMIFLTGGAVTAQARTFIGSTSNALVDKPFDARRLRSLINDRIH